jgi:YegS/Rv2252/BmrU family lipid kinase
MKEVNDLKKKVFLINSYSCRDKLEEIRRLIKTIMGDEEYETVESEYKGQITEVVKNLKNCVLYSVGGDGTLVEVINGAAGSDNEIFVVPAGTGNDFCRMLTDEKDYKKVLQDHASYTAAATDCGKAGETYFANIASVGYDAEIVKNSLRFKKIPVLRKISYIASLIYTIFTYKPIKPRLEIDGEIIEKPLLLAAFANGEYYGGGIHIAPTAKIDDGCFDVYLCDSVKRLTLITLLPKLLNGSHVKDRHIHIIKAKEIKLSSETPLLLNLDGELEETTETTVSLIEGGAKFYRKVR